MSPNFEGGKPVNDPLVFNSFKQLNGHHSQVLESALACGPPEPCMEPTQGTKRLITYTAAASLETPPPQETQPILGFINIRDFGHTKNALGHTKKQL